MNQFEKLRILRTFRKQHADIFGTLEGNHLVTEIGYHQAKGWPLTLKQLFLLDIGSIATVQRRLRRLKELGLVRHRQAAGDRRSVELTLSPKCVRIFAQYEALMGSKPAKVSIRRGGESGHVCGLCDSDAGRGNLLGAFLAQGFKRGDRCVLVAPVAIQNEILGALPHRRRASEKLLVSEGHDSGDGEFAFLKGVASAAVKSGRQLCLAADMAWALSKNIRFDAILDMERRFDAFAKKVPLKALCVYDARRYSSGEFLHAVKCHRDHLRHPVLLG